MPMHREHTLPSLPGTNHAGEQPFCGVNGRTGAGMSESLPHRIGDDAPIASYHEALEAFQKRYLVQVLKAAGWNQCKAARLSGVHRNTINRLMVRYGVPARCQLPGRNGTFSASEGSL